MAEIHPTAVIDPRAQLAPDVRVGPFAVVADSVRIGSGTVIAAHCTIEGDTVIGERNQVGPHAAIGAAPQIRGCSEPGALRIGDGNRFCEFSTVHAAGAGGTTRLGSDCMVMAYAHVAHDCVLGDRVELANGVQLGGHVEIGDGATIGGLAAVHQHCRLGTLSMVAGGAVVVQDVPPFSLAAGDRARLYGLNRVGLSRGKMCAEQQRALSTAWRTIRFAATHRQTLTDLQGQCDSSDQSPLVELIDFLERSGRGICRPVRS